MFTLLLLPLADLTGQQLDTYLSTSCWLKNSFSGPSREIPPGRLRVLGAADWHLHTSLLLLEKYLTAFLIFQKMKAASFTRDLDTHCLQNKKINFWPRARVHTTQQNQSIDTTNSKNIHLTSSLVGFK